MEHNIGIEIAVRADVLNSWCINGKRDQERWFAIMYLFVLKLLFTYHIVITTATLSHRS
jgi:hypothetical protein